MDNYPGGWFGESWDAPVNEESRHLPTPVGDRCVGCAGDIIETDRGMLVPFADVRPAALGAWHLDCFLRSFGAQPL